MGVSQSPANLSLAMQDLTKDIQDQHLQYFLQYLCYLDDKKIGVTAEEIIELQNKAVLQDPELNRQCLDYDCCPYKADLSPPKESMLGEVVPQDEQQYTHNLLRQKKTFGKRLFNKLILRAATV